MQEGSSNQAGEGGAGHKGGAVKGAGAGRGAGTPAAQKTWSKGEFAQNLQSVRDELAKADATGAKAGSRGSAASSKAEQDAKTAKLRAELQAEEEAKRKREAKQLAEQRMQEDANKLSLAASGLLSKDKERVPQAERGKSSSPQASPRISAPPPQRPHST